VFVSFFLIVENRIADVLPLSFFPCLLFHIFRGEKCGQGEERERGIMSVLRLCPLAIRWVDMDS
jgi:hypothetical protein